MLPGEGAKAFLHAGVKLLGFGVEARAFGALAAGIGGDVGAAVHLRGVEVEQDGQVGDDARGGEQGEALVAVDRALELDPGIPTR